MRGQLSAAVPLDSSSALPSFRLFWFLGFSYASFMALLLQKAVLPLFPDMHAGHGLFMNDAIVFHNMAVEIAHRIHVSGWAEWRLYPQGASANVGVLSALYSLFGPDPAWFIPFNAAAHATGALLIYRIGSGLVDIDVGKLGGLLAGICFLVFPSGLQWYGQNHKDAFAIVGSLLALSAWLTMHDQRFRVDWQNMWKVLVAAISGAVLLGLVRPYYVLVIVVGFVASFIVSSIWRSSIRQIAVRFMFIVLLAALAVGFARVGTAVGVYGENRSTLNIGAYRALSSESSEQFEWKATEDVPAILDGTLRRASELRAHFVLFGRSVAAGSEIDGDRLPNTAWQAIAYFPRALVVGLFAPFPSSWGDRVTLPRLIGAMETACWYLVFLGAVVAVVRHNSRKLLAGAVFCAVLITMLAYIHPNVGTLYRQRFGLWHFFMLIGCIGWVSLLRSHLMQSSSLDSSSAHATVLDKENQAMSSPSERMAGSGAVVMLITLTCYLGFFARDLLLTGQLGLGPELDAFFSAAMIPMFFVTCMAMPLGDAMVLPFVAARSNESDERERLLQGTLGFALLLLVSAMCFVLVSAPWLVTLVLLAASEETLTIAASILRWFAPIITLSAWTVIGNAALNSLGKPRDTALAQLVVPVVTLLALVLAPSARIMEATIAGMFVGTLINSGILFWRLGSSGLNLLPTWDCFVETVEVRRLYWPLVAAAILPAALVPMNYAFASAVTAGGVAAWAFASKIVILFSGLASVGATAVVLPQIAHRLMLSRGGVSQNANRLIAIGVWLGGVLMLGGFVFAEPLVASLLGKHLSASQIGDLASIVRIGLMQIPIVIVGALANKLAIALGRTSRVMVASMFAFAGNLAINLVLVPHIGVMGVAIGALIGGVLSVVILLTGTYRQIGLAPREIMVAIACWLAWVAVCVGLLSTSLAALVAAVIALGTMARLQWTILHAPNFAAAEPREASCSS
jgi:putative peptidoglycan lipid II flippase